MAGEDSSQLYTPAHHSGQMDQRLNSTNYIHPQETNLLNIAKAMEYDHNGAPILRAGLSNVEVTPKGRIKVSSRQTVFHNTSLYDTGTDIWDNHTTLGASIVHDANLAAVVMSSSTTPGSIAIRQSLKVMNYIPGRPAEFSTAFSAGPAAGARLRIGVFDENNGVYFEKSADGIFYCVVRSKSTGSVVENRVARPDWNGDKLDGTGTSGISVPPGQIQLIVIDYEWYGAGQVNFSFVIDGNKHTIHTFNHANRIQTSWMARPFQPIRIEVENISATSTASMTMYSTSFSLEGESLTVGSPKITGIPLPGKNLSTAFTYYPTVSIRLKSTQLNAVAFIEQIQAFTTDNSNLTFRVYKNATLSAAGGLTWTDFMSSGSSVEVNTNATSFTGGEVIALGVVPTNGQPYDLDSNTITFQIGRTNLGTASDIFTLALSPVNNNVNALGTLRWREQR